MKGKYEYSCSSCWKAPLSKDEVGACKKLLGKDAVHFYCIDCLASYLEVTREDIEDKIQIFKEEGCELFK